MDPEHMRPETKCKLGRVTGEISQEGTYES